ncbi:C4-dicarboxylate TRAP transporter substrate-binding protein [Paracoccus sp. SCSIO 75233]|uniref:C4-dicarboxylate TRAP transporter substrate-binding protein n=1 Tax=Paracoccus sp. SCSIO 75233 TaxID=3017782 RepID=UPI0022F030F3|nr:C4-dicarboxylate TRAP transporter substrate-binding protein [Paracoccus sp. SCSIO 75233]WBU52978.1 C4-dicarboxylate TRAP transporter substrate-binding protein [Paracoccus sp. SCSIO 75233]
MTHISTTLGALAVATALSTPSANAEELRFAIGVPENFTIVQAMTYFADTIPERTNGEITAKLFTGSSLLNFTETFSGVRDGIADMGYVVSAYHRAELKESNLIGDLGMLGSNLVVMAGAASEYCLTDAECIAEYQREGQVFLGFASTPPYRLISVEPLETLDDVKGKRIRSFSGQGRWAEALGAVQVNLPAGDIYEGFSQGTIDVNTHPYEAFETLSLKDVAKYVTDLPLGTFYVNALFNTNIDVWRNWDEATRIAVMDTAAEGLGRAAAATYAEDLAYHDGGVEALGVTVITPSPELISATEEFVAADVPGIATLNEETFGVTGAAEKIDRFRALVEKWTGLVGEIDASDPEAVAGLYRENIFGDVDKANYGL